MSKLKTAASSPPRSSRSALEHVPRRLPRLLDVRRQPHAAAHVEQQRHADRRVVVGAEVDDLAALAPLLDDEVLFLEATRETAAPVPDDGGNGDEIDRRAESGFRRLGGGVLRS